jgi:hypothetical protein
MMTVPHAVALRPLLHGWRSILGCTVGGAANHCNLICSLLCVECAGGSSSSAPGGSRLEDELVITLNKALAQANPGYKRIGIMGMLALLLQEGVTYELLQDADGAAAGEWCMQKYIKPLQERFLLLNQHRPVHIPVDITCDLE